MHSRAGGGETSFFPVGLNAAGSTMVTLTGSNCPDCIQAGQNRQIQITLADVTRSQLHTERAGMRVQFLQADGGTTTSPAPEPGSILLVLAGMGAIVAGARRRRKNRS
jgi:hypothetical protein